MGLYTDIDVDFARRTLRIIEQYDCTKKRGSENFEVTLLVNCLVGLLIMPHQRRRDLIPDVGVGGLAEWSIEASFISSWGQGRKKTLRQLVRGLRNSVAHFHIEAEGTEKDIERLRFWDDNGFMATIPVANLRGFVTKFASVIGQISSTKCD